jgi:hypothetical protein
VEIFKQNTWPKLEKLQVDGLAVCEVGLEHLILGHPTIGSLVLSQIALAHGSWKSLLTKLRNELPLDDFLIYGRLLSAHGTDSLGKLEDWDICPPKGTWKSSAVRDAPGMETWLGSYERLDDRSKLLREFVLRKADWPKTLHRRKDNKQIAEPVSHDQRRHWLCFKHENGTCTPDREYIDVTWDEDISEGVPDDWEELEYMHRLPSDLSKISATFEGDGWDDNGYDVWGFDLHGEHFSDLKSNDDEREFLHKDLFNAMMRDTIDEMGKRLKEVRSKKSLSNRSRLKSEKIRWRTDDIFENIHRMDNLVDSM